MNLVAKVLLIWQYAIIVVYHYNALYGGLDYIHNDIGYQMKLSS